MADAFETRAAELAQLPWPRPHLRDFDEQGCGEPMKSILLGASNSWFPITLSALSVPTATKDLRNWSKNTGLCWESDLLDIVKAFRQIGQLQPLCGVHR